MKRYKQKYLKIRGKDAWRLNPEWTAEDDLKYATNNDGVTDLKKMRRIRALNALVK
jgi:hypothetical protein